MYIDPEGFKNKCIIETRDLGLVDKQMKTSYGILLLYMITADFYMYKGERIYKYLQENNGW